MNEVCAFFDEYGGPGFNFETEGTYTHFSYLLL